MQRPNNAGGPNSSLWTADMGLGSAGSTFTGQNTRNLQHPAANMTGREGIPVFSYAISSSQPASSLHYKPSWGQTEQDTIVQQPSPGTLWKTDSASGHASNSDQTRSLLGTEQWGRESGGAPWGSAPHTESQPASDLVPSSFSTHPTDPAKFSRHAVSDSWLANTNSSAYQVTQENEQNDNEDVVQKHSPTEELKDAEEDKSTSTSKKQLSIAGNERLEDESKGEDEESRNSADPQKDDLKPNTDNAASLNSLDNNVQSAVASSSVQEDATDTSVQQLPPTDETVLATSEADEGAPQNAVGGSITQLQQLSLMDNYVHQQTIAAQLTSYQLMQQQYALAAQQQQLAAPGGMFLPSSYIIPAQPNTQTGYADPNTTGQFPIMAHYSPYAGWPATGMYPSMLQQQMAAAAASASVSSQQTTSPSTSQPNRISTQTPQSPSQSQSPSLQQQESGSQSQTDILANVAAMQQSNLNQAMAMAGYPVIPSAYYDQTGALIINNGRGAPPVRLFAPGPMFMNSTQPLLPHQIAAGNGSMLWYNQAQQATAGAIYANQQNISGGSTPAPSLNQNFNPPGPPSGGFGSANNISTLGMGGLGTGVGSSSSTPQRRDSFSDFTKHPQQPYNSMSQFYNSLGVSPGGGGSGVGMGAMSPSPGPGMMHGHHALNSPPPSMSSSANLMLGNSSRMFSAAPGAEAKYRNGSYVSPSIFGSSGSSLFPPTRIRPPNSKDMMMAAGRSKLLDDFRNNRLTNPLLHELVNHIVEFSQDQHGSRFIQQKLERATPGEKQQVFSEIIGSAYQLMTDVFGNYVIQKFFEFGSLEHKLALANCIHGHVLPLALQMYGCRVIQKALECIPLENQVEIVKELDGHLLKCVKDQNGNHVVQKCIECVPPMHLQFIVDGFKGQVVTLSSHPYGCRVMQRILEYCTEEQTAPILEELHQHTEMLVKDQYGNYVIQHILEHGRPEHKSQMVNELRGKILMLSQHKFASNVIEKCVSHSSHQNRVWLIEEVCQEPDALFIMMKDQYANYVVQKMLDVAEPQQKKLLIHKIRPHVLTLRKFTYGKHIITKLEKFFMKSGNAGSPVASSGDLSGSQLGAASWMLDE